MLKKYVIDLFVTFRFFLVIGVFMALFILAFYIPVTEPIALSLFFLFMILCVADYVFLFMAKKVISAKRITAGRLSNGDENSIEFVIKNELSFLLRVKIIDELPEQFQERNWEKHVTLNRHQQKKIQWYLRPLQRGEYYFGDIHLFISSPLQLVIRRVTIDAGETIPVYPSFVQLHKY
ncbi:MAG: hypothetical protein ABIN25_02620, partial [Ginsengibacter sp.]